MYHEPRADVAQLVEQRFRKAWVAGSNPAIGSRNLWYTERMDRTKELEELVSDTRRLGGRL